MSVWQVARAANAVLTRTVTGAILAPHETQRLVVSDKTGNYSSASPGKSKCGPIDYGRRNGDTFSATSFCDWLLRCAAFMVSSGVSAANAVKKVIPHEYSRAYKPAPHRGPGHIPLGEACGRLGLGQPRPAAGGTNVHSRTSRARMAPVALLASTGGTIAAPERGAG